MLRSQDFSCALDLGMLGAAGPQPPVDFAEKSEGLSSWSPLESPPGGPPRASAKGSCATLQFDLHKPLTFGVLERIKIGSHLRLPHGVDSFHSSHRDPGLPFQHFQT
ncbi:hypothetical protein P7K49_018596 [Saguinus oedipus]|uniref:Uncharacterized protein n=1 Tax=Saguinus oedipus TaxID=9490 RepID=A0ABQ9V6F1_SAGOE|nr:hypothetical protein P7K49_018596 [Saguinus oedipus]